MKFVKVYSCQQIIEGCKNFYLLLKWSIWWPLVNAVIGDRVGVFDWRKSSRNPMGKHHGDDVGDWSDYEKPVIAGGSGLVIYSDECGGWGNRVVIRLGYNTIYEVFILVAHLKRRLVKVGDRVKKGDLIGLCGGKPGDPGAGSTTAPHVHMELWLKRIGSSMDKYVPVTPDPMMISCQKNGNTPINLF